MSNTKHTPAPWLVTSSSDHGYKQCFEVMMNNAKYEQKLFNEKLIASAPELLEVLQTILEENTHLELNLNGVELGENAIKKATE